MWKEEFLYESPHVLASYSQSCHRGMTATHSRESGKVTDLRLLGRPASSKVITNRSVSICNKLCLNITVERQKIVIFVFVHSMC